MTTATTAYRRRPRFINGIEMPREADLRAVFGRRFTRLIRAYSAELGDNLNEPDRALIRQVCSLQLRIEQALAEEMKSPAPGDGRERGEGGNHAALGRGRRNETFAHCRQL
jgi:hypothetical protein